jgi:hypothetical protein
MPSLFLNFARGVNAAVHPRLLPEATLARLINGTVSSGFVGPRPGFVAHSHIGLDDRVSRHFERGMVQGMAFYDIDRPALIIAADGRLFSLTLGPEQSMRCLSPRQQLRRSGRIYLCQRGPFIIAQDGFNPPVIIRGTTATQGTHPTRGVPTGTLMAEGWGRLAVVSPDRTRIYFSNHIADPTAEDLPNGIRRELAFTEDTAYFLNTRFFQVPRSAGKIVAMTFTPSLNGDGNLGPLAVFCQHSTWLYNTRIPREQWAVQDIASNPLPTIGASSSHGLAVRGNDVLFVDQSGRIQQMRIALRRNDDARLKIHDAAIAPLMAGNELGHHLATHLPARYTLIAHRWERQWRNGILTGRNTRIMALNEDPAIEADPIWDGEWTGLYPVAMTTARWQGKQTLFIVSLDDDGKNRLYRLGETGQPDQSPQADIPIPWSLTTRADYQDAPFLIKRYQASGIRIGAIHGETKVEARFIADGQPHPWLSTRLHSPICLDARGLPRPQNLQRLTPPSFAPTFVDAAVELNITGQAQVQEINIEATPIGDSLITNATCHGTDLSPQFHSQPAALHHSLSRQP